MGLVGLPNKLVYDLVIHVEPHMPLEYMYHPKLLCYNNNKFSRKLERTNLIKLA